MESSNKWASFNGVEIAFLFVARIGAAMCSFHVNPLETRRGAGAGAGADAAQITLLFLL